MRISDIVTQLLKIQHEHGDLRVFNGPNCGMDEGYDLTDVEFIEHGHIGYEYGKKGDEEVLDGKYSGSTKVVVIC